jgi:nicotinate-nucleotide pyrophosphorylase (carboxylating)
MTTFDEATDTLIRLALAEDLGERGDVTSMAIIPAEVHITGQVIAKAEGVIAGLPIVERVYRQVDASVLVRAEVADGSQVRPGILVCTVSGAGRAVLTGERTALNFLQHLSGIATLTARYVAAVAGTRAVILDTRKTTPGWRMLEKYAVRMGGGQNHRAGLYDMALIKDNHIAAAGGIRAAVERVHSATATRGLPVVVEVEDLAGLQVALALGVDRILLDNMDEDLMRQAVQIAAGRVPLEASGNVTLERIPAIAATGVDFISIGALTHSAPAFDLSMRLRHETIGV